MGGGGAVQCTRPSWIMNRENRPWTKGLSKAFRKEGEERGERLEIKLILLTLHENHILYPIYIYFLE